MPGPGRSNFISRYGADRTPARGFGKPAERKVQSRLQTSNPMLLLQVISLVSMHAVFWFVTQPVNRFWVRGWNLQGAGRRFFSATPVRAPANAGGEAGQWTKLRNRWEYSHIARALLAIISLISLTVAIA